MFWYMIIRYFASRLKRKEYNWRILDNWEFRSSLPAGRQAGVFGPKKLNWGGLLVI
jgi:hypothetical protein